MIHTLAAPPLTSPKTNVNNTLFVSVCFLACAHHVPTCACPFRAQAQHLPARALPMQRTSCLHTFAMSLLQAIHIQNPCACPTLLIVHGLINIPCNANDVHRARLPHTCMRQAHSSLITHTLAMYVMPAVFGGSCHCMCGNTLTIPHAPSLSVFCPTLTVCPLPDSRTRGGVFLSTRVMCVSACTCVYACVSCVCLRACVCVCLRLRVCACVCGCACANAMCLRACTYAGVCHGQRACVRVSVCIFPSYLQYVDRNPTSTTASLSQLRGFAHAYLGLEHLGYIP